MEPATKQVLQDLKTEVNQAIARSEKRMLEQMRSIQPELLKAFGPWQDNIQARVRLLEKSHTLEHETASSRLDTLERRLAEIEKKLLLNPPAV